MVYMAIFIARACKICIYRNDLCPQFGALEYRYETKHLVIRAKSTIFGCIKSIWQRKWLVFSLTLSHTHSYIHLSSAFVVWKILKQENPKSRQTWMGNRPNGGTIFDSNHENCHRRASAFCCVSFWTKSHLFNLILINGMIKMALSIWATTDYGITIVIICISPLIWAHSSIPNWKSLRIMQ